FGAIERVAVPGLARVVRLHGPWFLNGLALGAENNENFARRVRNEGLAIERAAAVTAPSRDVLEKVREFYGIGLPNARVIANPGPRVASSDCWQSQLTDSKQILFIGRFDRHKGGDLMLRAFAKLAALDPEVRLVFAGPDRGLNEDGTKVDLPTYVERNVPLSARSRLVCLGAVAPEALVKLRKASAMCIAPSRYENFPMAIVEAFAYGCPIVGSATGGIKELIVHEQNGLLFAPEDVDDLVAQVMRLLKDPGLAIALASAGRKTYEQRLEPASVAEEALDLYRSLPNCESLGSAARLSA
ncbi:MAG TPA: glycosyltransferase family 4 protein, partial [Polyangiaceae bacterium]|nr:glycosyltransferase family 4 protein [Polyangiaceae bacterium]